MKVIRSIAAVEELKTLSVVERAQVWQCMLEQVRGQRGLWPGYLVYGSCLSLALAVGLCCQTLVSETQGTVVLIGLGAIGGGVGGVMKLSWQYHHGRQFLGKAIDQLNLKND